MIMKKYGRPMAGLFMAMAGALCLWGCVNDHDNSSGISDKNVSEPDMEDKGNTDNAEEQGITFSVKIKADDKPISLEEKLAGNDEVEKITIVVEDKAAEEKVLDYEYLENLEHLKSLTIHDGRLSDISFVSGIEQLNLLNLADNPIEEPVRLEELVMRLESLNMDSTGIEDVAFLAGAKYLKRLSLKNNQIKEFTALRESEHLTELDISGNPIEDPSIFLYIPNTMLLETADCEEEPLKSEIDKAFQRFNPMEMQMNTEDARVNNCGIGDFNGVGYDEPLGSLALGEYSGYMSDEAIVINKGRVYLCRKKLDGNEQNITTRVVSYHDGAWECEIYSSSGLYE